MQNVGHAHSWISSHGGRIGDRPLSLDNLARRYTFSALVWNRFWRHNALRNICQPCNLFLDSWVAICDLEILLKYPACADSSGCNIFHFLLPMGLN